MNKMKTIEIRNLKGWILFTHSAKNNTALKTLEKAVRNGFNLAYADLRYDDLRYADLRGAKFRYADLRGAKFTGADLTGADLSYALYTKAQINYAIIDETTIF